MTLTEIIEAAQKTGATHKQGLGVYQFFEGELCAFVDAVQADDQALIEAMEKDIDFYQERASELRAQIQRLRVIADSARDVIAWCDKTGSGDALWCVARLRHALVIPEPSEAPHVEPQPPPVTIRKD